MAFNPVNKHSRLKCGVSENNGIYNIFKAWAAQSILQQDKGSTPMVQFSAGTTDFSLFPAPAKYTKSFIFHSILHIAETFHHYIYNANKLCLFLLPLHCTTAIQ
jgi:hypothetical protein